MLLDRAQHLLAQALIAEAKHPRHQRMVEGDHHAADENEAVADVGRPRAADLAAADVDVVRQAELRGDAKRAIGGDGRRGEPQVALVEAQRKPEIRDAPLWHDEMEEQLIRVEQHGPTADHSPHHRNVVVPTIGEVDLALGLLVVADRDVGPVRKEDAKSRGVAGSGAQGDRVIDRLRAHCRSLAEVEESGWPHRYLPAVGLLLHLLPYQLAI